MGGLPQTASFLSLSVFWYFSSWLAYSSLLNIGISYSFLFDVLSDLISKWVPLVLDKVRFRCKHYASLVVTVVYAQLLYSFIAFVYERL